jgi:hypothetical protein
MNNFSSNFYSSLFLVRESPVNVIEFYEQFIYMIKIPLN